MKLVANIQLKPTKEQARALRVTVERCNAACNAISARGYEAGKTRKYDMQQMLYRDIREGFHLTAQAVIRCLAKVGDTYTAAKANHHDLEEPIRFRKHAAQPYDDRIFRFLPGDTDAVSIWALTGREKIPFVCGERQKALLTYRRGEADLMFIRGKWYLACVCDIPDPEEIGVEDVLGVDLGVVNIAFDSEGRPYTGAGIEAARQKFNRRRAGLQKRGSKAAKRKLKKLSGKEARFRKHTNHVVSKEIVANAERSLCALGLEDLTHIRKRTKVRKAQRNRHSSWSFAQLRQFLTYKAARAGIPVILVDPRDTSRGCPECGVVDKRNRPTQDRFSCVECGHKQAADFVGARNIRHRALQALGADSVIQAPQPLRAGTTERDAPHLEAGVKPPPLDSMGM